MFWIVVVQLLSRVKIFVTLWTATCQASMSFTNSYSLQFAQTRAHWVGDAISSLLLLLPSIFPSIKVFPISWLFTSGGQSVGASASASVLPMNIRGWFPLRLTSLISLQSKGLLRVFSCIIIQRWWLILCINLVKSLYPNIWSSVSADVTVKVCFFFSDEINIY